MSVPNLPLTSLTRRFGPRVDDDASDSERGPFVDVTTNLFALGAFDIERVAHLKDADLECLDLLDHDSQTRLDVWHPRARGLDHSRFEAPRYGGTFEHGRGPVEGRAQGQPEPERRKRARRREAEGVQDQEGEEGEEEEHGLNW